MCWLLCGQKKLITRWSFHLKILWVKSQSNSGDWLLPGGCGTASLGFLEGRAAGVAASGIEGVTGVAELPVLSELGCFSLLTSQGLAGRKAVPCLPCRVSHGIQSCSGPWPLTPSARLLCSSWWPVRVFIYNILMAILTPLIVNDRAISLSIAVWTIMFGLLKWQNIH